MVSDEVIPFPSMEPTMWRQRARQIATMIWGFVDVLVDLCLTTGLAIDSAYHVLQESEQAGLSHWSTYQQFGADIEESVLQAHIDVRIQLPSRVLLFAQPIYSCGKVKIYSCLL